MNALQRCFLCALVALTLLFDACRACPALAERINLDVWTLPKMMQQIEQGKRDQARGKDIARDIDELFETRGRIADDVAAGRMGLLEAATRFRDLNAANPMGGYDLSNWITGDSDEERCCRQVINWVETRLGSMPTAEAARVMERLEEELTDHLRREGTVSLLQ
jgi:hypothetical protein